MGIQENVRQEYKKCCEDEVDWLSVEQLHESTLQISNQCFEYKKLCVGVIGVLVAALLKLGDSGPASLTVIAAVCAIISVGFWLCDSTAYYYQKSNRHHMNELIRKIKDRNTISSDSSEKRNTNSWRKAFFNRSMSLYFYNLVICGVAVLYDNAHWFEYTY
ncbi:hypothetical protein [Vibrio jasicida]|uniref:hypothetical protein n=1 Tax=Vibrio jasicida TaxID=766224 RepID=UPI001C0FF129|nr:hypothetical protein [Vibrio jasicida]